MKKEEKDYLKVVKHSNGIGYDEAEKEIEEFENTQKQFKILNREMKKKDTKIRNLENRVEKLQEKIEKIKQSRIVKQNKTPTTRKNSQIGKKMFLEDSTKEESKKEKIWKKYSERINHNLEYERSYTKTDITKEFMLPAYVFQWAIDRLIKKDIVGTEIIDGVTRYFKK